jgi:hypothetical protein
MTTPRKLLLALCVTITALAFTASNASAAPGPIHFINEDTLEHCEAVLSNCNVHIASVTPTSIVGVVNGIETLITQCTDEFHAVLDEDPVGGFIHEQQVTGPPGVCTFLPCHQTGLTEWPIHSSFETAPNETGMRLRFCMLNATGGPTPCEINVHVIDEGDHQYEFRANGVATGSHCILQPGVELEVFGHWITENDGTFDDIEIIHEGD